MIYIHLITDAIINQIDKIISWGYSLGYVGLAFFMFINTALMIPPSEVICLYFGTMAGIGHFKLFNVIIVATSFNVAGTTCWYLIARNNRGGQLIKFLFNWVRNKVLDKIFGLFGLNNTTYVVVEKLFEKQGRFIIFIGRNVPIIRSAISIPAGLNKMNMLLFLLLTFLGTLIWVTIWTSTGYYFGLNPKKLHSWLLIIALIVISFGLKQILQNKYTKPLDYHEPPIGS